MKIGVAQLDLSGSIHRNTRKIEEYTAKSLEQEIEVLAFPETALTGYIYRDFLEVEQDEVEIALAHIQAKIKNTNLCLIVGTPLRVDERLYNSAVVLLPDGRRFVYHKRYLTSYESDYFSPGDRNLVFDHRGHKIGVLVCRDQNRPEYASELKSGGAQCVFILSAHHYELIESRMKREKNRALPVARAYENNMFVCKANSVGTVHGFISYGTSMIVDPRGITVIRGSESREELLSCEAQLNRKDLVW
jgi:predicted amidohydrolase